ncbi:hypothetical protein P4S72_13485 [Vibrio sp. PP-XX7]
MQDDVVTYLTAKGAKAHAWRDMRDSDWSESFDQALAWGQRICAKWGRI